MNGKMKTTLLNILKNLLNVIAALSIMIVSSIFSKVIGNFFSKFFYVNLIFSTIVYLGLFFTLGILYVKKVLKMDLDEIGFSFSNLQKLGKKNVLWVASAFLIPSLVLAFYFIFVPGAFVISEEKSIPRTLVYAIFQVGIWAAAGEEFVMRGIIFRYMKKTLGFLPAIIIPSVIFGLLHISNMEQFNVVDVLQLIIGGTAVAVMFTLFAEKTEALIPGMFVHALWNILVIGGIFGVGEIVNGTQNSSLIQFYPESANHLLTGGKFGIEIAIPAIVVYIIICVILAMQKKNKTLDENV